MASGFQFSDPKEKVPESELMALTQNYKQKQDLFRARLERGGLDLEALSRKARDDLGVLLSAIQRRVIDLAQAESDVDAIGARRFML